MTIHEQHMALIHDANLAKDDHERWTALCVLRGWRDGVRAAGRKVDLIAADLEQIGNGDDRPMCAGVWLDWQPSTEKQTNEEQ